MPAPLVQTSELIYVVKNNRVQVLRSPDSSRDLSPECFDAAWWEGRDAVVGTACGRGTVYFVQSPECPWALRHYMRGGWMARCSRDRYLWTGLSRSRPWRELQLLAAMRAEGLPVPKPVGARIIRNGCSYTGDIITEYIPSSTSLGAALRVAPLSRADWTALGGLLRRFHHHQVRHDDINAGNILRDAHGNFHVIDFDKACFAPPGSWQSLNLRRLRRSLEKGRRKNPTFHFDLADWEALEAGYANAELPGANAHAPAALPPRTWRWRMRLRLLLRSKSARRPTNVALLGLPVSLQFQSGREVDRVATFHHEATLVRRILDHLQPGDVIYDVGANIGLISLVLALHPKGRASQVHSFEPEPRNFQQLERNIAANELGGRVTPHQLALGEKAGHAGLFVRGTAGEGRHSLVAAKGATGCIEVQVATASEFAVASGAHPNVVKIDVEGAEGQVLAGMESMLRTHPPRDLFMEVHNKGGRDQMPNGQSIGDWLQNHGYTLQWEQQRRSGRHRHYSTQRR